MRLLPGVGAVAGAVQVQDHVVAPRPFRHRLDRGVADHQVDHDDDAAERLGELRPLVHVLHGPGGDVQIGALDLAGQRLGPVHRLHAVQEPVAPVHEGLRVDVLVVLGEVEPALQRLVHHPAVVAAGQAQLRLHRGAQQRPAELVQPLALDHDPGRRPVEGLHIGDRQPHVLQPQRLQRLEAEDVADDRRGQVGDRPRLEQVQVIGDVGEVLARLVRHRVDPIGLGPVLLAGGQPVGPDHGPGGGGALARHRRRRLDRVDIVLRRDPEQRQDVGVLRLVVGLPIAHLPVFHHAGLVAVLAGDGAALGVQCRDVRAHGALLSGCGADGDARVQRTGPVAFRHLGQGQWGDLRGLAGRAELLVSLAAQRLQRRHRRLQELARVELARASPPRCGGSRRPWPGGNRCRC